MEKFDLYTDIRTRTNGEIYIGVVGPVRTGKSTFVRKFMEQMVLPSIDEAEGKPLRDELPASASGKTVTTVEPKFVPKKAFPVEIGDGSAMKIRLVDCVGFLVPGAEGASEGGKDRMVKTPWDPNPVPFEEAARIGTKKVITDHATVGLVVTTDGSFGDLPRESFYEAEKETIELLRKMGKPFLVIVNSSRPYSREAEAVSKQIAQSHGVHTMILDCEQMGAAELRMVLEQFLLEFPLTRVFFQIPKWVETLDEGHWLKQSLLESVKKATKSLRTMRDITEMESVFPIESKYITQARVDQVNLNDGSTQVLLSLPGSLYYEILSEMTGADISSEYQLISLIREMSMKKREYDTVAQALASVRATGYGTIAPARDEITMREPVIIRQGNRYGVKIAAEAPSIHLIRADVTAEVSPIVGSEDQAKDLVAYIGDGENKGEEMWNTLIFGKSIDQLVEEGIHAKLSSVNEDCRKKLQNAMLRIVNDSLGNLIFIII
ncbi:MAG: stage IV sporulation protein A [Lachnospiraceae bacterium]|nr:stage IV sporulation protein A [Lachnospiraceae bacterium]